MPALHHPLTETPTTADPHGETWNGDVSRWTESGRCLDYNDYVDPVRAGLIPTVPHTRCWSAAETAAANAVTELDFSAELKTAYPATTPALLSSFITIAAGDEVQTQPQATSELYYCMWGSGSTKIDGDHIPWRQGDLLLLPSASSAVHRGGAQPSCLFWVHDQPLLNYLGALPGPPKFDPVVFPRERLTEALQAIRSAPGAANRARLHVLLHNEFMTPNTSLSPVLWAVYGVIPQGEVLPPHRHQSAALDLILDCAPGCYTLCGTDRDSDGQLVAPVRTDWQGNSAFVTPPGQWHSHHNDSGADIHLLAIQDAGLHNYLRTLGFRSDPRRRDVR